MIDFIQLVAFLIFFSLIWVWFNPEYFKSTTSEVISEYHYYPENAKIMFNPDPVTLSLVAPQEVAPALEYTKKHSFARIELRPFYAKTTDTEKNTVLAQSANQRGQLVQDLLVNGGLKSERIYLMPSRPTDNILVSDPEARRVELTVTEPDHVEKDAAEHAAETSSYRLNTAPK